MIVSVFINRKLIKNIKFKSRLEAINNVLDLADADNELILMDIHGEIIYNSKYGNNDLNLIEIFGRGQADKYADSHRCAICGKLPRVVKTKEYDFYNIECPEHGLMIVSSSIHAGKLWRIRLKEFMILHEIPEDQKMLVIMKEGKYLLDESDYSEIKEKEIQSKDQSNERSLSELGF